MNFEITVLFYFKEQRKRVHFHGFSIKSIIP